MPRAERSGVTTGGSDFRSIELFAPLAAGTTNGLSRARSRRRRRRERGSHLPEKPTGNWKMIRFSQNDVKAKNAAAFPVK